MLYWISSHLSDFCGPLRLFGSHAFLLALSSLLSSTFVLFLLPRLWNRLPHDHGKAILGKDGMKSAGKPTGGGFIVTLLLLPVLLVVVPMTAAEFSAILFLMLAMVFGYLDDRAEVPWGELKKGLLDIVVSVGVAASVYAGLVNGTGDLSRVAVWFPFLKGMFFVSWWIYIPLAAFLLWVVMNATNCSDGVDGLAGSLTVITLLCLAAMLYLVMGNMRVAHYFLIPVGGTAARCAARWAVMLVTVAAGFSGYLWWNAEPSRILMGDAGSRFLGLLVGAGALVTGNPFLVIAFAPIVLVNGGGGLVKLVLLRFFKKCGLDVTPTSSLPPEKQERQNVVVRMLHGVRFPLHDHCKRNLKWSNAQVLMRFMLLQAFLTPLLFVLFVKVR